MSNPRVFTFVILLSCLAAPGCAGAQEVVLADGRSPGEAQDHSEWLRRAGLIQATEAARAHWRAIDPGFEEELHVMAVASGSFTERSVGEQAVLYAMSLWPRCCPRMGLAVVADDRLVANVAFEGLAHALSAVPDLDGDGRDELVLIGSFGMGGQESTMMTLASFGSAGLAPRGTASILETACAAGPGAGPSSAARVLARPGPELTVERFEGSCEGGEWRLVSGPEPLALDAPSDDPYVTLPEHPSPR